MIFAVMALLFLHVGIDTIGWSLMGNQPALTTTLSAGITASETTMPVASVSGFPSQGQLYVEGEWANYTATTTSCPSPWSGQPACFTGVSRGRQQTTAISHAQSALVYNEAAGLANDLSNFESRTAVDDLGDFTTPWSSGAAMVRFLTQASTWDWPMFEGPFAFVRIFGALITIALGFGIFLALGALLISGIQRIF